MKLADAKLKLYDTIKQLSNEVGETPETLLDAVYELFCPHLDLDLSDAEIEVLAEKAIRTYTGMDFWVEN